MMGRKFQNLKCNNETQSTESMIYSHDWVNYNICSPNALDGGATALSLLCCKSKLCRFMLRHLRSLFKNLKMITPHIYIVITKLLLKNRWPKLRLYTGK